MLSNFLKVALARGNFLQVAWKFLTKSYFLQVAWKLKKLKSYFRQVARKLKSLKSYFLQVARKLKKLKKLLFASCQKVKKVKKVTFCKRLAGSEAQKRGAAEARKLGGSKLVGSKARRFEGLETRHSPIKDPAEGWFQAGACKRSPRV